MLKYISIIVCALTFSNCQPKQDITTDNLSDIHDYLQSLLEECVDDSFESVSGVSMSIQSPTIIGQWSGSAGYADKEHNHILSPTQPFRIASVTKTFVAAAILRLHEIDSLSINDPISQYIDNDIIHILIADNYNPDEILIKHCLNHTSGLFDYAMGSEQYINTIISNPNRVWTRKEQLQAAVDWGDKLGAPGELTKYSDSGYVILGAIIESFYERDLAHGLRDLLKFDKLKLDATWLEDLEEGPIVKDSMVHRYHGRYETTDWDASIDLYGGGGLVSTTHDLSIFIYALFNNEVYDRSQTLKLMQSIPEHVSNAYSNNTDEMYYHYGYWAIDVFDKEVYIHTGFWGTLMLYVPSLQTSVSINTTNGKSDRLVKKTISFLQRLKSNK